MADITGIDAQPIHIAGNSLEPLDHMARAARGLDEAFARALLQRRLSHTVRALPTAIGHLARQRAFGLDGSHKWGFFECRLREQLLHAANSLLFTS